MLLFPLLASADMSAVTLTSTTVDDITVSPSDCTAGFRMGADGKKYATNGAGGGTYAEVVGVEWVRGGSPSDFEMFATVTSGSLTSGTTGSWIDGSSNRDWTAVRTNDAAGTDTAIFTLDVRRKGTSHNLASATITLNAQVTV